MPSPFQLALAASERDLDSQIGESVQVTPMTAGDFGRRFDPDRPAFDVVALIADGRAESPHITHMETRILSEEWQVEILRSVQGSRRIRKDDELTLLDRPGSPRLIVNRVERTDEARLIYICGPTSD